MKQNRLKAEKKIKRAAGFESKTFSVKIGKVITTIEAHSQLVAAAKGTTECLTTSGM